MCRMTIGDATCIFLPKSCVGKPGWFGLVAWRLILRSYMILLVSPLKGFEIHPKGSDPLLGSDRYKPGIFAKNLQNDEGRVKNYPYFAQISDFSFIPNMSLACVPGPCGPKKAKLGRNLLLCHFPAFSSLSPQLSLRSNPSFLQGHWLTMAHWYLLPFFTT